MSSSGVGLPGVLGAVDLGPTKAHGIGKNSVFK